MRNITFNGYSNETFGLTLSGNTPLLIPRPKQSSIEVAYANGTVDTSEMTGQLYFQDSTITYELVYTVPNIRNGIALTTAELNVMMTDKTNEITEWLYSGPATLIDTGLNNTLYNADCENIDIAKSIASSHWILKFTVQFKADYVDTNVYPYYYIPEKRGRFIVYNGRTSYDVGLDMISMTPVTVFNGKIKSLDIANRDGTLNLTHGRNGRTSGKDSMFYKDIGITYKFVKFFPTNQSQEQMCRTLQEYIDAICNWLYKHSGQSFITIDGYVSYGGTDMMLMDSAWIEGNVPEYGSCLCRYLPSARVTGLDIQKSIFNDRWGLTFDVTFTAYPEYFTGNLYLPEIHEQQPPVITVQTWKHYAEVNNNERYSDFVMAEISDETDTIFVSKDNIDLTTDYAFLETGSLVHKSYICPGSIVACLDVNIPSTPVETGQTYCVMLELPPYIELTCDGVTLKYIPYFTSSTVERKDLYRLYKLYSQEGEAPITPGFAGFSMFEGFSFQINVTLLPIDADGVIFGPGRFTREQLQQNYPTLKIPMTAHYVQTIKGNNYASQYGVWGEHEDDTPSEYYILKAVNLNYTSAEMDEYEKDTIIPYNTSATGDVVNFNHPDAYKGTNYAVVLQIPVVNGVGNNYIFCDSKKPNGGDIQCL